MTRRMRRFALFSTLGLILVAVMLALLLRWVAVRDLESQTLASHTVLASTLSTSHAALIALLMKASPSLSREELVASAEVEWLNQVLIEPLRGLSVVRIKIYTTAGRLVYSTEANQIGEQAAHNYAIGLATGGETASKIIHRDTFNTSDGIIEHRDLVETYVPLRRNLSAPVEGVFELYSDVTPLLDQINRTQSAITVGVLAVLGCFYAVVLVLFRRADRELQREQATTHRYLEEIEQARSNLEERVAERTREVAESEQRFRDVAEAAGEYIWEVDRQGRFTYLSDRVEEVLGYKPAELIGRTPAELMPAEDAARVRALFAERGTETSFANHEHRSLAKSGQVVWQSVSGVPIRAVDGHVLGHRGANFDITPRKRAEEELENTRQQYFHREKMAAIGQLAAGIIHEVGNPVAAIFGAVETTRQSLENDNCPLPDCPLYDEARKGLDVLREQVARLTTITREVSEFATPRVSEWQWLDLNQLVRSATKLLRYDPRLDGIELDLHLDSQLPAIVGSPDQLTQVIFNLLVNAEDACQELPQGQGVIRVSTRPQQGGVRLAIRDNGCGMDEAALAKAFEAYFTTKHLGEGLGLGLSLCRSIVAEHGGACSMESAPGKGTTVSVDLPLNTPAAADHAVP